MSRRPNWWLHVLAGIWPITWISARATRWPVVGPLVAALALPLFSRKNLNISYIPINEGLGGFQSSHLPREIVRELIEHSSHRVIIERCTCRDARDCKEHPATLGCTLLGEGTKEIDPRIARHVSVAEAQQHLDRTLADGLIPMVGRVRLDNFIWGVRDRGHLLTVCHCCRCCCTIFASGKYLPEEAGKSIVRAGRGLVYDRSRALHGLRRLRRRVFHGGALDDRRGRGARRGPLQGVREVRGRLSGRGDPGGRHRPGGGDGVYHRPPPGRRGYSIGRLGRPSQLPARAAGRR